jgi:hypothetical protein
MGYVLPTIAIGLALAGTAMAAPAFPGAPAARLVRVDAEGVLRWQDTGDEVALFGVNYYAPFAMDYHALKAQGVSPEKTIDQDLLHLARMGLDVLRLHCWDREISDRDGNLVENEHVRLLDYLVARAKARGMYAVLTPIAWWGTPNPSEGFSNRYTMPQMTADPGARKDQANYLSQFVRHVNVYTGLSYAEDPAVIAFELINEPLYDRGTTDAQVTAYIDALADAVRKTGCHKPLFYNGWQDHLAAVRDAHVDGCTFGWYPTGLVAGRSLWQDYLSRVDDYPSMRDGALRGKARIVYEFDAADVPGCFMYPAMARAFRSGGAQIATQFQYDAGPLATTNLNWQTHYLNLVCAPRKAVSFLIAGEAFRRLPRLKTYGKYPESVCFGPFRVDYASDLSEMVTEAEFLYANSTPTQPPVPEKLRRIVGCGSSLTVRYEGEGAYFLDKLADHAWRLEVYPDAVWVNDPYGKPKAEREVCRILWRTWPMEIRLADLGTDFSAEPIDTDNTFRPQVRDGRLDVRPGVYLLKGKGAAARKSESPEGLGHVGFREFFAQPAKEGPPVVCHDPPREGVEGKPAPVAFTVVTAEEPKDVTLALRAPGDPRELLLRRERAYRYAATIPAEWIKAPGIAYGLKVQTGGGTLTFPAAPPGKEPPAWQVAVVEPHAPLAIFSAGRDSVSPQGVVARQRLVPGMSPGQRAIQVAVDKFGPAGSAVYFRTDVADQVGLRRDFVAQCRTLHLRARALEPATTAVEVVLIERDGTPWGTEVRLRTDWKDVSVPVDKLRCFKHWGGVAASRGREGDRLRTADVAALNVCFGTWLYPDHAAEPHTIEIESILLE